MKIKEIYVECKLSKNYNTYTVGLTGEIVDGEDVELKTKELQTRARKLVKEQMSIDLIKVN